MRPAPLQASLFLPGESPVLPRGFSFREEFITGEEEAELLGYFLDLPFAHDRLGEYFSKRRVVGFGWGYDFRLHRLVPGPPLPPFLLPLARRIAKWLDIGKARVAEALVTEYREGAGIGWHRDTESFSHVVGISLAGPARLRLRPSSWRMGGKRRTKEDVVSLLLPPRSAYVLDGESRWKWQHSVAPVGALRYSITFRTLPYAQDPRMAPATRSATR